MNYPDLINIQYQIKKWLCYFLILKTDVKNLTGFGFQPIKFSTHKNDVAIAKISARGSER